MTGAVKPTQADKECVAEMLRAAETWPGHDAAQAMREIAASHRIASQADLLSAVREAREALDYAVRQMADGDEPDIDEDGDEICPFDVMRTTLARLDTLLSEGGAS